MKNLKQDVFNTIIKIAEKISGKQTPEDTNFDTPISTIYYDLYLDSLDEIEIVMKTEKYYGIIIKDNDVTKYRNKTLGEFCDLVCTYINQQKMSQEKTNIFQKIKQHFQHTK